MPKFNADKIAGLISEMRKALDRLKHLGSMKKIEFLSDPDKISSSKYNFIIAIESAIDICSHIISQNGFRIPEDYGDAFQVLFEQGAFNNEFTKNLKAMTKFRNRLVHIYWEVDDDQIYTFLQNNLTDFKIFLDKIARFLKLENI